ncbi:hypothetical protein SDC9_153288 [bioreactor metagenome]|uniref:Uncharacterized protein n=1 Tax=bioreactor metagenome TaxID=1076179 RepID=A0A645F069_9ZZZZ
MRQNSEEHEDHVDDIQGQVEAGGCKIINQIAEAHDQRDDPEDLAVLDVLGGSLYGIVLYLLFLQQGGVNGDRVLLIGMHAPVDKGHENEDDEDHDKVHGMENSLGDRNREGYVRDGGLRGNGQRNGA